MTSLQRAAHSAPRRERPGPPAPLVLLIADSPVLTAQIEAMLRSDARWRLVVAGAATPTALVDEHDPAAVVLAVSAEATTRILEGLPDLPRLPPVIVLAADLPRLWTARARRAGLRAVLRSDASGEEIRTALAATLAGLVVLHPDALGVSVARVSERARAGGRAALTAREVEILEMMAEGMGNRRIATRLGISGHTVKFHVTSILAKLGAATRTEAVAMSIRDGRISV